MNAKNLIGIVLSMRRTALLMGVTVCGAASLPAEASTVALTDSGQMYWTAQFVGSSTGNTQTVPTGQYGNDYSLSVPGQYSFLDSFGNQTNVLTGTGGSTIGSYAFQDSYKFSLSQAANGDALVVSLNLQGASTSFNISNLQFRLYEVSSSSAQPGLAIPAGSTVITPWTGISGSSNGTSIQADFSSVQSGTYFLDVAGTANGSEGGTYIGQLNLSPVPLPAAFWLFVSGLGLFGGLARSRSRI